MFDRRNGGGERDEANDFDSGWDHREAGRLAHLGSAVVGSEEDFNNSDTELIYSRRPRRRLHLGILTESQWTNPG
jgi:hypothetical protein